MTKRRKVVISIISILCILLIGLCVVWGVCESMNNQVVTFVVADTLSDGSGKKAKVIILAGQSNASGCSQDEYLKQNVSAEKYAEYESGYNNVYINYLAGLNTSDGFVKCSTRQGEIEGCFGPELGLAEELNKMYPDEMFFIIKCAWGGSNLNKQWRSPSAFGATGNLYKQFRSFVKANMEYLTSKNYDVEIEGMCWMQGESDSCTSKMANKYKGYLTKLINDVRKEFAKYESLDGIAFVDAYIANNPEFWTHYDLINMSKKEVSEQSDINTVIDTVGHGLSCMEEPSGSPDLAHYDSLSEIKLGNLFAEEISKFFD